MLNDVTMVGQAGWPGKTSGKKRPSKKKARGK